MTSGACPPRESGRALVSRWPGCHSLRVRIALHVSASRTRRQPAIPQVPEAYRIRDSALHGSNQWPDSRPEFTAALRSYLARMDALGAAVMRGIALGLGLRESFFAEQGGGDPYWVMRVRRRQACIICRECPTAASAAVCAGHAT